MNRKNTMLSFLFRSSFNLNHVLTSEMTKFVVDIAHKQLNDLRSRLQATRWPDSIHGSGWEFGVDLHYMKDLCRYWATDFNWRNVENEINSFPNFIMSVDGITIHFIHIKSKKPNALPLIITHGWPGSFLEMFKLARLLQDSTSTAFHLVIPSIVGFGFSQRMVSSGCNSFFIAALWHKLMANLGYAKYIAQGGDFGAGISTAMALQHPDHVIGIHLNYIPGSYLPHLDPSDEFSNEEKEFLKTLEHWYANEGAYAHQHRTRPLTLAYGLNDSPAGLCAWIVEKFYYWSDCNGNIEHVFTKDELLGNVSLYWLTETIHSSIRLYNENSKKPLRFTPGTFVRVPVAIARFAKEAPFPPRKFVERGYNIQQWTDYPSGGHFAAMEKPHELASDIIKFAEHISMHSSSDL
jgi:pimeloyl-ACP methyl ester carboxylesterase